MNEIQLSEAETELNKFKDEFRASIKREVDNKFYWNPDKYLSLDDVGELHLQWFYDRYAALRLIQRLPIFNQAYEVMTERENFSRKNAFGEMHGDCYMWIERNAQSKVICYENQNERLLYISEEFSFHIRRLDYKYNWHREPYKQAKLEVFRRTDFKEAKDNPAFHYGDCRDVGYIGSVSMLLEGREQVESAGRKTLHALKMMDYWQPYLDNPNDLE
jgi:hypothetical protein